jgi:hypothetical protein
MEYFVNFHRKGSFFRWKSHTFGEGKVAIVSGAMSLAAAEVFPSGCCVGISRYFSEKGRTVLKMLYGSLKAIT